MMKREEPEARDIEFMRKALLEAEAAGCEGEVPIGAVVECGGRIIARGHNMTEALMDATAHAEMQALTSASNALGGKYLSGCTLYVTVEPCAMCAAAMGWAQVSRLVYGAADPKRGFRLVAPRALHPKTQVVGGVLEKECAALMLDFFRGKR